MQNRKILLIDSPHSEFQRIIEEAGYKCDIGDDKSEKEILEIIDQYVGAVVKSRFKIQKDFFDKAKNLKFIARVGAGVDHIDTEYAKLKEIECITSPEGNRDALGEHTVGLVIALLRFVCRANAQIKTGNYTREVNRGHELNGNTVGIIGYGNMGSAFAQRLKGFDVNVIAYDKYKTNYADENVTEVDMETIYRESDFLSLHVPLTDETRYLINDEYLNRFKKNIYIINTARGPVIKTEDLVKSLKSGKVKGAALDVLEYEMPSYTKLDYTIQPDVMDYLSKAENVILSPHIAGITFESSVKHAKILAEKIISGFGLKENSI